MEIATATLTTTGLKWTNGSEVRRDYDDWYCFTKGHAIDAPDYVPSGQTAYHPQAGAFACILNRDLAFWRFG